MNSLKKLIKKFENIIKYSSCSLTASALDITLVFLLKHWLPLVAANTIGVICGTFFHYILTSHLVFHVKIHGWSAVIYCVTFLISLFLNNALIMVLVHYLSYLPIHENIVFFIAKPLSALIPFFIIYILRKQFFDKCKNHIKK